MFGAKNTTGYKSETPRTRPGATYPGGKSLRKAYANLHRRKTGDQPHHKLPDSHQGSQSNFATVPGSMRGRK